jgi:hypothetical protein
MEARLGDPHQCESALEVDRATTITKEAMTITKDAAFTLKSLGQKHSKAPCVTLGATPMLCTEPTLRRL